MFMHIADGMNLRCARFEGFECIRDRRQNFVIDRYFFRRPSRSIAELVEPRLRCAGDNAGLMA